MKKLLSLTPLHQSSPSSSRYKGGVILVSHDERLLKMVCQELWVCSKGKVGHFPFLLTFSNSPISNPLLLLRFGV